MKDLLDIANYFLPVLKENPTDLEDLEQTKKLLDVLDDYEVIYQDTLLDLSVDLVSFSGWFVTGKLRYCLRVLQQKLSLNLPDVYKMNSKQLSTLLADIHTELTMMQFFLMDTLEILEARYITYQDTLATLADQVMALSPDEKQVALREIRKTCENLEQTT